jgi:hypothetical protein
MKPSGLPRRMLVMLGADTDYARIVAQLTKQQLAPYVSYTKTDTFNGMGSSKHDGRVVVRISDGAIVSGDSSGVEAGDYHGRANPVTHSSFEAACYRATSEAESSYNGQPAIRIELTPKCESENTGDTDYPFTTLYADARTLLPLDVNGTVVPADAHKSVTIALDQTYAEFDGRVLPARLKVDVAGSGWMFWLHVHVTETYADYRFLNTLSSP